MLIDTEPELELLHTYDPLTLDVCPHPDDCELLQPSMVNDLDHHQPSFILLDPLELHERLSPKLQLRDLLQYEIMDDELQLSDVCGLKEEDRYSQDILSTNQLAGCDDELS